MGAFSYVVTVGAEQGRQKVAEQIPPELQAELQGQAEQHHTPAWRKMLGTAAGATLGDLGLLGLASRSRLPGSSTPSALAMLGVGGALGGALGNYMSAGDDASVAEALLAGGAAGAGNVVGRSAASAATIDHLARMYRSHLTRNPTPTLSVPKQLLIGGGLLGGGGAVGGAAGAGLGHLIARAGDDE